jgi:hypothetical protein
MKTILRDRFVAGVVLLLSGLVSAQTPTVVRDQAGVTAMTSAVAAMGGASAVNQVSDSTVQGTITLPSGVQGTVTWQTSGNEFRYEVNNGQLDRIFVSGHGMAADLRNGSPVYTNYPAARAALPYHLPSLVLAQELIDPHYKISFVGQEVRQGQSVLHVHTENTALDIDPLVTPQEWYFDSTSFLPVAVQYRLPDPANPSSYQTNAIAYANYQAVNGILLPFSITVHQGDISRSIALTSVVFNSGLGSHLFDNPNGGAQ